MLSAAAPAVLSVDLLAAYARGAAVFRGASGALSVEDFSAWTRAIAAATAGDSVVIACAERDAFAAAFVATVEAGRVALLPSSLKVDVVRALAVAEGATVLHDRDQDREDASEGVDVRALRGGASGGRLSACSAARSATAARPRVELERVAAVFYTSGSTGAPVAHAKTGAQLLLEAEMQAARLGLSPADCVLPTVPPHHVYGCLFGLLIPLAAGASIAEATPAQPSAVAREARALGATTLVSVPAHLRAIAALAGEELRGGTLRRVISSGAPLDAQDADGVAAALGVHPEEILGSTETGGIGSRLHPSVSYTPLPGVEILAAGGRLRVRSPYLDGPGFTETADAVRLLPDGRFFHDGRVDDVVKVGSKRVSASGLEAALRRLPGVADAVVRPLRVEGRGARLVAFVAPTPGASLVPASLRAELIRHFDDVVVPRAIHVVPSIPRSPAGKVSVSILRALLAGEAEGAA